jgi:hypothetical protein
MQTMSLQSRANWFGITTTSENLGEVIGFQILFLFLYSLIGMSILLVILMNIIVYSPRGRYRIKNRIRTRSRSRGPTAGENARNVRGIGRVDGAGNPSHDPAMTIASRVDDIEMKNRAVN